METLLHIGLSNAIAAAILALLVASIAWACRRPALVHSLWLLVLLKLITPPIVPVQFSWLARSQPAAAEVNLPVVAEMELAPLPEPEAADPSFLLPPQRTGLDADLESVDALVDDDPPSLHSQTDVWEPEEAPAPTPAISPGPVLSPPNVSWQALVFTLWLAGAVLWWTIAGLRLHRFHKLLRYARPAPAPLQEQAHALARRLGLSGCPGVWLVPAPVSPMLWAMAGKARLLMPAPLWSQLTRQQQDTLLVHELAHWRRRDHWVRGLELVVLGLYWWHPVVWWARREIREAEEQCCDAWVVWALPAAAGAYASALVETMTFLSRAQPALPLTASGVGHVHLLRRRLIMIMRGTTPRSLSGAGLLAVLGLGAVLLPLTWAQTERPRDASPDKPETQQAVPPKVATSAVGVEGTGAQVTVSQASATVRGSAQAGEAQVAQRATTSSEPPRTGVAVAASAEEIEKARDEVELLEVQLAVKRAQYGAAEIGLQTAEERFRRFSELSKKGAVGQQELEEARLALQSEKAQLMVKKAEVMEPEVRLKQARRRLARLQGQPQEVDTRRGEKSPYPPANRAVAGGDPQIAELKRMLAEALNENKKLRLALEARSEGEARQAAVLRREMEQLLKEGKVGEANILKRKLGQPPEAANVEKYQAMFQELLKEGRVEEAKMLKEKLAAAQAAPARDKEQARLEELERKLNALIVAVEDLRRELRAQPAKDKEKH